MSYLIDLYILCKKRTKKVYEFLKFVDATGTDQLFDIGAEEVTFEEGLEQGLNKPSFELSLYRDDSKRFNSFSVHYIGDAAVLYSISIDETQDQQVPELLENMMNILDGDFAFAAAETPPAIDLEDFYQWVLVAPKPDWVIGDISSLSP